MLAVDILYLVTIGHTQQALTLLVSGIAAEKRAIVYPDGIAFSGGKVKEC